ncbi:hypothetical protein PspLS_05150 [Pyricularia sp. CBS 133598]|nr:hypothetical protein PspLS_05150 [Pyricularia sp. CBS 133598]
MDGGVMMQTPINNGSGRTSYLVAIPLDRRWKTDNPYFEVIDKPASDDTREVFHMWLNDKEKPPKIYTWGGLPSVDDWAKQKPTPRYFTPNIESGKITGGQWKNDTSAQIPAESPANVTWTRGSTYTTCNGKVYLLGGQEPLGAESQARAVPGLVIYDLATKTWARANATGFGPGAQQKMVSGTHRNGVAVCLATYGTDGRGIVVFLGGEQATDDGRSGWLPMGMDVVYMFDIGTGRFHSQRTTDQYVPRPRNEACAVAVQQRGSADSYEIFLFGGRASDPLGNAGSDVYVLTVPGFHWIRAEGAYQDPRYSHACAVVGSGGRQMLSIGGIYGPTASGYIARDTWTNGMMILDMTGMFWRDTYDPDAPAYQRPSNVSGWYSANNLDSVRWSSEETKALFPLHSNQGGSEPPDQPPGPPPDSPSSSPPTAAIAGGVVGGVALIAALATVYLLIRRRRLRREFEAQQHQRYLEAVQAQDAHGSVGETAYQDKPMLDSTQVVEAYGGEPQQLDKTHELPHEERPHEMRDADVPVEMPADDAQRRPPEELSGSPIRPR